MFDKETFATNLKVERMKHRWSQIDLAKASGVSLGSIARYETSENVPTLDTALQIARALGCSIDALCGRIDERMPFRQ